MPRSRLHASIPMALCPAPLVVLEHVPTPADALEGLNEPLQSQRDRPHLLLPKHASAQCMHVVGLCMIL